MAGYQADHVFDDIENPVGAPVDENDIALKNDPLVIFRQTRQPAV